MFFSFCLPHEYPENDWPAVWSLEACLQAELLEMSHSDEYADCACCSPEDLAKRFCYHLREYGFLDSLLASGANEDWIDSFIRFHAQHILTFIQQCQDLTSDDVLHRLHPRQTNERLVECCRRSGTFREFIAKRREQAHKQLGQMNSADTDAPDP